MRRSELLLARSHGTLVAGCMGLAILLAACDTTSSPFGLAPVEPSGFPLASQDLLGCPTPANATLYDCENVEWGDRVSWRFLLEYHFGQFANPTVQCQDAFAATISRLTNTGSMVVGTFVGIEVGGEPNPLYTGSGFTTQSVHTRSQG